jgi:hypothetical protein
MKFRAVSIVAVLGVAALSLVDVGTHATFTTITFGSQSITAGVSSIALEGSCINGTTCSVDSSNDLFTLSASGSTLIFVADTPPDVSFTTGDEEITATNTGNLALSNPTWMLDATGGTALEGEAYVCATSTGIGTNPANSLLYNGPLSGFIGTSYALPGDTLSTSGTAATPTSGPSDNFVVDVYAGSEPTECGNNFTNGVGLGGGTGQSASVGSNAVPGVSEAPPLNPDASGESVAVSATLTYQS